MAVSRIVELILAWERFSEKDNGGSLESFAKWILEDPGTSLKSKSTFETNSSLESVFHGEDPEFARFQGRQKSSMQGAYLIGRMNQYVTFYTKPMMKKHGLHSLDDFGYLQNIRFFKNITRTKACELMLQELTTGIDIIKRLIRNGFITEVLSADDKRQKLLNLTRKGELVLENMIVEFRQLPDTLGDLSEENRQTLLGWLNELDVFHDDIVKCRSKKSK